MTGDDRPDGPRTDHGAASRAGAPAGPSGPAPAGDDDDDTRARASAAAFAGAGLQFAAAILVFLFAGRWLDRRLGTEPVFLLLGVFLGAGAGFYAMYRRLTAEQARDDERRRMKAQR